MAGGGITRAAYAFASRAHVSVGPLLKRANLSVQQIKNPRLRIPVKDQIKFLNLVADKLRDEFLGIRLAQTLNLRELGLLYYVMASSDTLGDALRRGARYSTIQNEGVQIDYRGGKVVTVTFNYIGVARQPDRHQIEIFITILLRVCQELSGLALAPLRVKLMHHRSRLPPEIKRLFGEHVAFACDADEVVYPGSIAAAPSTNADPYLNALLVRYCEDAAAKRRRNSTTWQLKVENAIVPLLPRAGAHRQDRRRARGQSANAGAPPRRRRPDIPEGFGQSAFRSRPALSAGEGIADVGDYLAARVLRNQRPQSCVQTLDRAHADARVLISRRHRRDVLAAWSAKHAR